MLVKTLNAKMAELNIPVLLETSAEKILVDADGKADFGYLRERRHYH